MHLLVRTTSSMTFSIVLHVSSFYSFTSLYAAKLYLIHFIFFDNISIPVSYLAAQIILISHDFVQMYMSLSSQCVSNKKNRLPPCIIAKGRRSLILTCIDFLKYRIDQMRSIAYRISHIQQIINGYPRNCSEEPNHCCRPSDSLMLKEISFVRKH